MKRYTILSIITASAAVLFTACGGGGNTESSQVPKEETQVKEEVKAEVSGLTAQLALGEKIYKEKCIVCHMADAKGVAGAFPPLAGSDYLLADPKRGIHQTLNGSHEVMVVNGVIIQCTHGSAGSNQGRCFSSYQLCAKNFQRIYR